MKKLFQFGISSALIVLMGACGSALTPADSAAGGIEVEQKRECVDRFSPDTAAEQACRENVKNTWDTYWSAHFADGGIQ